MKGKRLLHGIMAWLMAAVLSVLSVLPVTAQEPGSGAQTGSIVLRVHEKAQVDLEMSLYKVADMITGGFTFTREFASSGISVTIDSLRGTSEDMLRTARALADYAKTNQITPIASQKAVAAANAQNAQTAGSTVTFSNLSPALYLAAQTAGQEVLVQPLLVPIPFTRAGGDTEEYNADITAKSEFAGSAVIVSKVDENGAVLAGAQFVLQQKTYLAAGQTAPEGAETGTDAGGSFYWKTLKRTEDSETLTSNEHGQIVVENLAEGTYRFVEVDAPDGFILVGTPAEFTIDSAGKVEQVEGVYRRASGSVAELEIENPGTSLTIHKHDADGLQLSGAVLVVKDAQGNVILDENGDPKYVVTTTNAPSVLRQLPAGTYYLSEVTAPDGYTVADDVQFTVSEDPDANNEVTMVDTPVRPANGSLAVTKRLIDINGDELIPTEEQTFYVALFADAARTQRVSDVKPIRVVNSSSATVTFENLEIGTTYYIGETDEGGTLRENVVTTDISYAAEYPDTNEITLTAESPSGERTFQNRFSSLTYVFSKEGKLTVTKRVLVDGKSVASKDTFYAAIFTDPELKERLGDVIVLDMDGANEVSQEIAVPYNADGEETAYYVAETDVNGNPLSQDSGLAFTFSLDKSQITLSTGHPEDEVIITNNFAETETEIETETDTPETPGINSQSGGSGSGSGSVVPTGQNSVRTGDETPIGLIVGLLAASAIVIILLLVFRRRRKTKDR